MADESATRVHHASSFGAAATIYERGRPTYPAEAIDWLLPPDAKRVLDLGAGTGKLTRDLLRRGLDVVAVEPSEGMRAELRRVLPDVGPLAGSAENIPFDAASVDVVLVAQAWHWVDPARAVPEIARVLKPGGRLGLVWNHRDERVGWIADLGRIMHRLRSWNDRSDNPPVGPPFGPIERRDFTWSRPITPETLLELVASRSHFIVLSAAEQADIIADVRGLVATLPGFAAERGIPMAYVTRCSRADLA